MPCWYYDKKELRHSPSIHQGISVEDEVMYRREGARFILQLGNKMGLRYETMATGVVYFHRFYMIHSFQEFPRHVTACCCLFLAGKVEETPKKCKDIMKHARSLVDDATWAEFGADPREEVMTLERILLQTIKFDFIVEHPYTYLLKYAKCLKGDKKKLQNMVQMAWTFVNDGLCTTLCLQWEPEIIAIALMYLAGKLNKFEVVDWQGRSSKHQKWWDMFVQGISMELLEDICHQVLDLYSPHKTEAMAGGLSVSAIPGVPTTKNSKPAGETNPPSGSTSKQAEGAAKTPQSQSSVPPPAKKSKREDLKTVSPTKTEVPVITQPSYQYPSSYPTYPPPPTTTPAVVSTSSRYPYPYSATVPHPSTSQQGTPIPLVTPPPTYPPPSATRYQTPTAAPSTAPPPPPTHYPGPAPPPPPAPYSTAHPPPPYPPPSGSGAPHYPPPPPASQHRPNFYSQSAGSSTAYYPTPPSVPPSYPPQPSGSYPGSSRSYPHSSRPYYPPPS